MDILSNMTRFFRAPMCLLCEFPFRYHSLSHWHSAIISHSPKLAMLQLASALYVLVSALVAPTRMDLTRLDD
ncbi:hypothetical protein BDZ89DRAFT_276801 [Hymenopellis radicata]|nr:hypothetical protein BDZ89DRAFT_276801 [Hymenopellis radicata]